MKKLNKKIHREMKGLIGRSQQSKTLLELEEWHQSSSPFRTFEPLIQSNGPSKSKMRSRALYQYFVTKEENLVKRREEIIDDIVRNMQPIVKEKKEKLLMKVITRLKTAAFIKDLQKMIQTNLSKGAASDLEKSQRSNMIERQRLRQLEHEKQKQVEMHKNLINEGVDSYLANLHWQMKQKLIKDPLQLMYLQNSEEDEKSSGLFTVKKDN